VIASDFYNASGHCSDERIKEIIESLIHELLPHCSPPIQKAKVVDYECALSRFCVPLFSRQFPRSDTLGNLCKKRLFCAGDWVRMGDEEHRAKGRVQERARCVVFLSSETPPLF